MVSISVKKEVAKYQTGRRENKSPEPRFPTCINRYISRLLSLFAMTEQPEKYGFAAVEDSQLETVSYEEVTIRKSINIRQIAA